MLEIDDTSETAILQKVATTNPLKIAETSTNSNTKYKVVYYGKTEDENRNLWDFELSNTGSEKMVTVILRYSRSNSYGMGRGFNEDCRTNRNNMGRCYK